MMTDIRHINFTSIKVEVLKNLTNLKIQENLIQDYDVYYLTYKDLCIEGVKIYGFCLLVCISFFRSVWLCILCIPFSIIYPFFRKEIFIDKRKEKLLTEFKDFFLILKSNLEASYSIENSFIYSKNEMKMLYGDKSYMYIELSNMCNRLKMNVPINIVFDEFARKTKVGDIQDFSDSLMVIKEMGGNINSIINNVISIINDKIEVERDIATSTASKRFEQNIMSLLPFFIIIYLNLTSSEFLMPLYTTFLGKVFMVVLLGVYFASVYLSKKILDIEV
ncbi:MAG: type II secretion system F family protein [Lachnospiraceae bacterium]|nr:type II secretion system F family protein [Lachnospiraceae bacterium]